MKTRKSTIYLSVRFSVLILIFLFSKVNSQDFYSQKIVSISSGLNHTLAIDNSGNLWAWGANGEGELGDGTTDDKLSPLLIKSGTKFTSVSAGQGHSLAIDEAGNLWVWGYNQFGQLGDGTTTNKSTPVQIKVGTKFKVVSAGSLHSLAIDESGYLWVWGDSWYGDSDILLTPIQIKSGTKFNAIAAGDGYSLAIDQKGGLWFWGRNDYGQMEDIITTNSTPEKLAEGTKFKSVAAGWYHSLAIDESGNIWAWGSNVYGQFGNGLSDITTLAPALIQTGKKFKAIAAGPNYTLAVEESGKLWACGNNGSGQLGDGTVINKNSLVNINPEIEFNFIETGDNFSLGVDKNGKLWAWGNSGEGQIGNGLIASSLFFVEIKPQSRFKSIASGAYHALNLDDSSNLWGWGYNDDGRVGDGTTTNKSVPVQIKSGTKFKEISAGMYHSLSIDDYNNLWAWGYNFDGQLGIGSTSSRSVPIQVKAGTKFKNIAAGGYHSMGIDVSGNLWAWGNNEDGEIGDGTTTGKTKPIQIKSGTKFKSIAAGDYHSIAIDETGNLWAWGYNGNGRLGDGTTTYKSTPVQIKPGTKFLVVEAGRAHSLAIDESGNLWSWGYNAYGSLGDGSTISKSSPVQVKVGTKFKSIAGGKYHSMAIDENGNLWAWGNNGEGELGDGTTTDKITPVQIKAGTRFKGISAGYYHSFIIDENGILWACGYNGDGQLGDGSNLQLTPLWINDKITILKTSYPTNIYSFGADLGGYIYIGNDKILSSGFELLSSVSKEKCSINGILNGVYLKSEIKNLTPGLNYTYRAFAITNSDTLFADTISFTTPVCSVTSYSPKKVGNFGKSNMILEGKGFNGSTSIKLFQSGQDTLRVDTLMVSRYKCNALFNFTNKPKGNWDIIVDFGDSKITIKDGLEIEDYKAPEIMVELFGPKSVRPDRFTYYTIYYKNLGNTNAYEVPIPITVTGLNIPKFELQCKSYFPEGFENEILNPVSSITNPVTGEITTMTIPTIPIIPPEGEGFLTFGLNMNKPMDIRVTSGEPMFYEDQSGQIVANQDFYDCLAGIKNIGSEKLQKWGLDVTENLIPGFDCYKSAYDFGSELGSQMAQSNGNLELPVLGNLAWNLTKTVTECATDFVPVTKAGKVAWDLIKAAKKIEEITEDVNGVVNGVNLAETCIKALNGGRNNYIGARLVTSIDPNDKIGYRSPSGSNFFSNQKNFTYIINFENKSTATAPAQEVFITDTLDLKSFNLNSFRAGYIRIGSEIFQAPINVSSNSWEVDMRPAMDLITRVELNLDKIKGIAHWHFKCVDPKTNDFPNDALVGFLPPNDSTGKGEGSVTFTIDLKETVKDESTVNNRASIVFDYNAPIMTPTWSNKKDTIAPVSSMMEPLILTNGLARLTWNAIDNKNGSGVFCYSLFMKKGNEDYIPLLIQSNKTRIDFSFENNVPYSFYVTAIDSAENAEQKINIPDITIKTTDISETDDLFNDLQVYPNPSDSYFNILISGNYSAPFDYKLLNSTGQLIKSEKTYSNSWKLNLEKFEKGIYFLQVQLNNNLIVKKMVLQ